jgi:thiol-disulfide isomerase/thioredoxin
MMRIFTMRAAILTLLLGLPVVLVSQQQPWEANEKYRSAETAYRVGNYEQAARGFEQANEELGRHCAACLAMAARAYGRAGHREPALASSAKAVELAISPTERSNAHLQRGSVFLEARESPADLLSAEAEARSALAEDPHNLPAQLLLGLSLLRQGRAEEGLRELHSAETAPAADAETREVVKRWVANPKSQRLDFMPDFRATTVTGETLSLSAVKGKVVLLDFWATWCLPCRVGLPDLKRLQEKYKDRLVVLSISVDDSEEDWRGFVSSNGMTWPQFRDTDGSLRALFESKVCPTYLLIDRTGVLRLRINGMDPENSLSSELRPTLEMLLP